jgi:hypothetical protein
MQIKITTETPDIVNRECLAMGFFMDERPPKDACGLVDWRLNGLISREMANGHISGAFMEGVLITSCSRISSPTIFLFGLGSLSELTYDRLYHTGHHLWKTMDGILCHDFAFSLPAAGRCHLDVPDMTEAMIRGSFDYLSKDIEKWATCSTSIIVRESYLREIMTGLENFQHHVRDVSVIEIENPPSRSSS